MQNQKTCETNYVDCYVHAGIDDRTLDDEMLMHMFVSLNITSNPISNTKRLSNIARFCTIFVDIVHDLLESKMEMA